jgi:hypothetical protein
MTSCLCCLSKGYRLIERLFSGELSQPLAPLLCLLARTYGLKGDAQVLEGCIPTKRTPILKAFPYLKLGSTQCRKAMCLTPILNGKDELGSLVYELLQRIRDFFAVGIGYRVSIGYTKSCSDLQ